MTPAPGLALRDLRWAPDGTSVLDGFSATFAAGAITAIVGRSGCGKSSLLRVVAGLRELGGGEVSLPPGRLGFVFQDAALLPWRTAAENVALPGEQAPVGSVAEALAAVGLAEHADKLPAALSGGQRMRVSFARALVGAPSVLLLDEPFAALDAATRRLVQDVLLEAWGRLGCTVLLVTHDLVDAARLADRILVVDGPPLRVVADVPVDFPRPRGPETLAAVTRAVELG